MLALLAQANDQAQANPLSSLILILPFFLIMYFLVIRPQSQRRKAQMRLQSELEVGDEVVTTAGIYGTITEIDDEYGIVTLEVAPGMEVRFSRAAVAQRLLDDEELDQTEDAEPGS
jgi:preprotein translocase subunit YajC